MLENFLTREAFFENARSTSWIAGALLFATSWLWIGFLVVLIGTTEIEGLVGVLTVLVPFTVLLAFQALIVRKGQKQFPRGYSLLQYIESRFHMRASWISWFWYVRHALVAISGLVVGGYLITTFGHVSPAIIIVLLSVITAVLTVYAGFRSLMIVSFGIGLLSIVLAVGVVPWVGAVVPITAVVVGHIGMLTTHQWTVGTLLAFFLWILSTTDQDLWQRVYALKKDALLSSFVLGVCFLWGISLVLGFIARIVMVYGINVAGNDHLFTVLVVMVAILSLETIVSAVTATGSIVAVSTIQENDIVNKYSCGGALTAREERLFHEQDDRSLHRARVAMLSMLGISFVGAIITLFWIT